MVRLQKGEGFGGSVLLRGFADAVKALRAKFEFTGGVKGKKGWTV